MEFRTVVYAFPDAKFSTCKSLKEYREGDIPEAILKSFLAVDSELKSYGNATELTGSTG